MVASSSESTPAVATCLGARPTALQTAALNQLKRKCNRKFDKPCRHSQGVSTERSLTNFAVTLALQLVEGGSLKGRRAGAQAGGYGWGALGRGCRHHPLICWQTATLRKRCSACSLGPPKRAQFMPSSPILKVDMLSHHTHACGSASPY
eukprot:1179277-Prorocentrum_minimum.AAC.3